MSPGGTGGGEGVQLNRVPFVKDTVLDVVILSLHVTDGENLRKIILWQ